MKKYEKPYTNTIQLYTENKVALVIGSNESANKLGDDDASNWTRRRMWMDEEDY